MPIKGLPNALCQTTALKTEFHAIKNKRAKLLQIDLDDARFYK